MSLGDFWFQSNNGKKYNLDDFQELKIEDLAKNPKLQKFIKLFDTDGSGKIELKNKKGKNEWKSLFVELQKAAGDNDLSSEEFGTYISKKIPKEDITIDDVNELLDVATGKTEEIDWQLFLELLEQTQYQVSQEQEDGVSEYRNGDELVKRVETKTAENGDKIITETNYENGHIKEKKTYINGICNEITTYTHRINLNLDYMKTEDNSIEFSNVTQICNVTKDGTSISVVSDIDNDGKFEDKNLQYKLIKYPDGSQKELYLATYDGKPCICEATSQIPYSRITLVLYAGESIADYENNNLERIYEQVVNKEEISGAEYENGNTVIYVQNNEYPSTIAENFGTDLGTLKKMNPQKGNNSIETVGARVVVPGIIEADEEILTSRNPKEVEINKHKYYAFQGIYEKIYSSAIGETEITEEMASKNVYEYAEKLLLKKGVKKTDPKFAQKKNDLANELIALNGNKAKYAKGCKVKYIEKTLNKATVDELKSVGFEPNEENHQFYARFNYLEPKQQQNVIAVLKHCKANGITDKNKINAEIVKYYPEIQLFETDMKVLQKPTKAMARSYYAQYILEQIEAIEQYFESIALDWNYKTAASQGFMALQEGVDGIISTINEKLNTDIPRGETRQQFMQMLLDLKGKCLKLIEIAKIEENNKNNSFDNKKNAPEAEGLAFEQTFAELFPGKTVNYDAISKFLEVVTEFQKAPESEREDTNSAIYKKLEKAKAELDKSVPGFDKIQEQIEKWGDRAAIGGNLVELALITAAMILSGGSAAIASSTMSMGNSARASSEVLLNKVTNSRIGTTFLGRFLAKEGTKLVIREGSAYAASIVTSSIENAAFFQIPKVMAMVSDGNYTKDDLKEKWLVLNDSVEELFKFGLVGSAIAGPLGAEASALVSKVCNSERAIASTIKLAINGNGTTLDKVLKFVAENSGAISKFTEFGTSFSINAGYMAIADGTGYKDATANLAQMDAVTKLVVAMLGGKTTAFLTPQKVQQIRTELAGFNVRMTVYKGQKVIEVTDKMGKTAHLANEEELLLFVIDRAASVVNADCPNISNLTVEPIKEGNKTRYKIISNGEERIVDNVNDAMSIVQAKYTMDRIEASIGEQFKNGQDVTAKSLLGFNQYAERIQINGVELNLNDVLENSQSLDKLKISKTNVDGKEVYVITLENGKTETRNSLEEVLEVCRDNFNNEIMRTSLNKMFYQCIEEGFKNNNVIKIDDNTIIMKNGEGSYRLIEKSGKNEKIEISGESVEDVFTKLNQKTKQIDVEQQAKSKIPEHQQKSPAKILSQKINSAKSKDVTEMISSFHLMVRGETAYSSNFDMTPKERFRLNCEKLGMSESEMADLEAYQQTAIDFVKKVQSENARRAFSIRIKDSYSSELFPDIRKSQQIKRNSKKMIQNLEENPQLVELYRELERISKAENERTGYDQDINHLHSHIQDILEYIDPQNAGAAIELARFIESKGTEYVTYLIEQNLQYANISETDVVLKKAFYEAIKNDSDLEKETSLELLKYVNKDSYEFITTIYPHLEVYHKNITSYSNAGAILFCRTKADADVKLEIFKKYGVDSFSILKDITAENGKTAKLILEDSTLSDTVRWAMFGNEEAMKKYQELKDDPDILDSDINILLFGGKTSGCIELVNNSESIEVYKLFSKKEGFPKELIAGIAVVCTEYTKELALMMSEMPDFPPEQIAPILREVKAKDDIIIGSWDKTELTKLNQSASALLSSGMPPEIISPTIKVITKENLDYSLDICTNWQKQELLPKQVPLMIYYKDHISTQQFRKLNRKLGADVVSKLAFDDIYLGAKFADIIDVKNINEIPLAGKKEFIRNLVDCNTGMFEISDDLKPHLPLLPTNNEQYCGLMRAAVKSLGIETNPLAPEQKITLFNHSMKNLSETMANLSDSEFAGLTIEQEFSREDFISVVREKTKGLSTVERQKVYDYYGFEIHHKKGRNQRKELTLTGYPVNLNNGQKLAEITDPQTRAVVESLRENVVRFSEKNPIKCNNKQIETFLNEVVEAMPEIRSMIGRKQHGTHDFDVMQHSLKVMQKIVQEPKFEQLNESDQKIMLLASLLHDITKAEGISDGTHASEGSFDAYYISKKFKLSRDEELKLSDLIRHHEWLGNVNRDIKINTDGMKPEDVEKKKQEILTKRLQAAAFDMQNDNLFDMVMIFTHADLKAVKADDTFHDTREGDTRAVFDKNNNRIFDPSKQAKGVRKSHGEAADIYAERIREYIHELQKTRPLTPTTKIPTMSEIRTHITQINPDGSTNIKGVYVDSDGLIVIKVNDVEDWEAMGFPAGTTTKGILANVNNNGEESHQVETGNFKLMAHGLDYPNQLAKFEAFSMPSSESMLSLTYMERPETKSRNFRPQGVGLDFDSKYVYGGGETDAGSGCGKTISDFKQDYIFGGHREGDRKFVADIVKNATGMTDEEYIQFYEANKDKAWEEFDNQDIANTLIRAFAEGIHSDVRAGGRAYTEFYGSNPKRVNSTWVFSLDPEEKIGNPLEFLHRTDLTEGEMNSARIGGENPRSVAERTQFLREFSLNKDHDVPMLIFGDGKLVEKKTKTNKDEMGKLAWKNHYGRSITLNSGLNPTPIVEGVQAHNAAKNLRDVPVDDAITQDRTMQSALKVEKVDDKTNEMIRRYNELADKRDTQALSNEEVAEWLGLSIELQSLGYRMGSNQRLDFNWNINSEEIPNLGMTKTELRNKLSAMGISDFKIEMIERNANRINIDLLNSMDPKLIEEFGSSIIIDFDGNGDNVAAKIEIANVLKNNSMIPTREKGLLISRATKDNCTKLKQKISTIEQNLNYLKTCNLDESVIDFYARAMCEDRTEFSRELFDVIKDNKELVNSDICLNVPKEDVPFKIEIFNMLKGTETSPEMLDFIIRKCNKNNIDKMRIIEGLRSDENTRSVEEMYHTIEELSVEQLRAMEQCSELLDIYDVTELAFLSSEDIAAKKEILSMLKDSSIKKSDFVRNVTKDNLSKCKLQINYLINLEKTKDIPYGEKYFLSRLVTSYDVEIMGDFLDAIKYDYDFVHALVRRENSLKQGLVEGKTIECKTKEEAKQKIEIYNLIKNIEDTDTKLYYLSLLNESNFESVKASLIEDLPVILKYEAAMKINYPQFTEAEQQEVNKKMKEIENTLVSSGENSDVITLYLDYFKDSKTMESFNAKYSIFQKQAANNDFYSWVLKNIVIQEQADIVNKIGVKYKTDGICDKSFAQKYQYLKCYDEEVEMQRFLSYRNGDGFVTLVSKIESPEEFQRLMILWADRNVSRISSEDLPVFIKDANKFRLYQEFSAICDNLDKTVITQILYEIAEGNITEIASVEKMQKNVLLKEARDILDAYRSGKEQTQYFDESKEEVYNSLKTVFPNLNIKDIENVSDADMNILSAYISLYQELTFEQIENAINNSEIAGISKRYPIIKKYPADTAFYLAFCSGAEFEKIVSILEKRPEILIKPYDKVTFIKLVNMSDSEWEALKVPIAERRNTGFNPQQYSVEVQELLNSEFTLDLDPWNGIERHRMVEAQNHLGAPKGGEYITLDGKPLEPANRPVLELPSPDELIKQLETTGSFTLEIGNVKDLPPIQVKDDKAIVKPNEPTGVQETDQSINIGETRIWDNHRLARDLLQNFYDGNGHTMEGVTITVEKRGDKYAVKIGGRGIFDYDRVLDFGGGSKGGQSKKLVYGLASGDPESAGHHGEGSKVIAGNLLCTRGSGYVRYASGDWILTLGVGEENVLGERVITKEISKAPECLEGTTYEFETDDIDLVRSILEAKDYFNGPSNVDWATPDIENEYFAIKFLPKGEKGNLYVVQRFEVEGQEGFDGTLDGITLIFKRQPNDEGLKNYFYQEPYKLEVGRNRVGLTQDDIREMVKRYAMTLDNESLAKIIGQMEESFKYNSDSPNRYIANAFIWAAYLKGVKIDFGHDKYIATSSNMNARYIESYGKILVDPDMRYLGVPTDVEFQKANDNEMMPKIDLTEVQKKKLQLLSEAMRMFNSYLDLENSDIISAGNVQKPVYVTEAIVQADENATGVVRAQAISDCKGYYGGHWVKESYLNEGDFFDLLATWLHETSHKVDGDGTTPFNERLMKLQELIVEICNTNPSFGQQLRILSNEFYKLSGKKATNITVTQKDLNDIESHIAQLLREAVEKASVPEAKNVSVQPNISQNVVESINIFRRLYQRVYNMFMGTSKSPKASSPGEPVIINKRNNLQQYKSPAAITQMQTTLIAATPEQNIQKLEQTGKLSIKIPVEGTLSPKISDSSILPNDRKFLGKAQNSSLTLDYNNAQEWTREIIARDLLQNFYDGHNGTLDGVDIEIQEVNGKYKVKISGQSEYNYFYLKTIGASDKTADPRQAGGFGEGAKMASKTLLGEGLVDKITFASGDWTMDFTREEGVPRENNPHLARTLYENTERVDGTYVEFETSDKALVEAIIRGKDYFHSSENVDFIRIKENGIENDDFGFVVLPEGEKGNLYYIQRYAIKEDGQLEGALNGLSIVFKRQLSYEEKQDVYLQDDPDRKGFTAKDIDKVTNAMAKTMTKEQLIASVEQLERFLTLTDPKAMNDIITTGRCDRTPEQNFALALVREAGRKDVEFDTEGLKMAYIQRGDSAYDIQRLQKLGYKIVFSQMGILGIPSVKDVISKMDNVSGIEMTDVEKQKIVLLKDAFNSKFNIKLFESDQGEDKIRRITNEWGNIQYIAVDRSLFAEMDFNTLYSQILIQYNFDKKAEQWGYNMTHMISNQLYLSNDPLYVERYNALAKAFNELK